MTATKCFNCNGSGVGIFFPHVESLVLSDADWHWFFAWDLAYEHRICPYCDGEDGEVTEIFHPSLLIWGGPF